VLARHVNLAAAAAENVARRLGLHAAAAAGLVAGLALVLAAVAVGEGLKRESLASVAAGADLYCGWDAFGRAAPLPVVELARLGTLEGVERVVPRVVGQVPLGGELAVLVGVPLERLREEPVPVEGELPDDPSEVLVGRELARALGLAPGATVALEAGEIRLFMVAGVAGSTASLWSAKAIVCDLAEAQRVFRDAAHVTDACLYVRAGYEELVADSIRRLDRRFRVQSRELVAAYVGRGATLREGLLTALFALALALAIPSYAVIARAGVSPRRREIGLLKTVGWSTADVLEMVAVEAVLVALASAALALLVALAWVDWLGAPLIGPLLVADLPAFPAMHVPSRFLPLPATLAFVFALTVTSAASIPAAWRTAVARPIEALR
jgi:ABC-type lipoprotein release transport system permease subunit